MMTSPAQNSPPSASFVLHSLQTFDKFSSFMSGILFNFASLKIHDEIVTVLHFESKA